MFEFIKKFFSGDNSKDESKNLINTLVSDHKELLNIYTNIMNAVKNDDFLETRNGLKKFVNLYNKHILLEDTQLYIALKEKYQDKKTVLKVIQDIEKDMDAITRALKFFEKKYTVINADKKDLFIEELEHIGKVLVERVTLEEERLYPLL